MSEWGCLRALSPLDCFSLFRNRWFVPSPLAYFPLSGFVFTAHYCKSGRGSHTLAGLSLRPYVTASWVMVVLCIVGQSHYNNWTSGRLTYYLYKDHIVPLDRPSVARQNVWRLFVLVSGWFLGRVLAANELLQIWSGVEPRPPARPSRLCCFVHICPNERSHRRNTSLFWNNVSSPSGRKNTNVSPALTPPALVPTMLEQECHISLGHDKV